MKYLSSCSSCSADMGIRSSRGATTSPYCCTSSSIPLHVYWWPGPYGSGRSSNCPLNTVAKIISCLPVTSRGAWISKFCNLFLSSTFSSSAAIPSWIGIRSSRGATTSPWTRSSIPLYVYWWPGPCGSVRSSNPPGAGPYGSGRSSNPPPLTYDKRDDVNVSSEAISNKNSLEMQQKEKKVEYIIYLQLQMQ